MKIINDRQERQRFLKFAFVGVTGTIVDFGIMNLLRIVFQFPLIWAQGISFMIAVVNNFIWNRFWTYPDSRSKDTAFQFLQFVLINIVGILVRTPLITWLDRGIGKMLNIFPLNFNIENYIISQNLALAMSIFIILFWNYFANRFWTYSDALKSADKGRIEALPDDENKTLP